MFSKKMITALALAALSILLVCTACGQWIPASTEINLGDFKLTSSISQTGTGVYHIGGSQTNSIPTNNSSVNNSTVNNTTTINSRPATPAMIDLTGYARDRLKGNLTGYTNIMYPLSESRGSTASTSTSAACGCG